MTKFRHGVEVRTCCPIGLYNISEINANQAKLFGFRQLSSPLGRGSTLNYIDLSYRVTIYT